MIIAPPNDRLVRVLLVLLVMLAALFLSTQVWHFLQEIGDVLLLFFLSWLVAFTLRPLARVIQRYTRLTWPFAVATVYLGLIVGLVLVMLLVIPQMVEQLTQFVLAMPDMANEATRWLIFAQTELAARDIAVDLTAIYRPQELVPRAEAIGTEAVRNSVQILTSLASGLFTTLLILFLSFYIMLDDDGLVRDVLVFVPERYHAGLIYLGDSIDRTFGAFMRGQLIQSLVYAFGTAVIMQLFQLPYVLLASVFAGVVMIIPFFGTYLAVVPPLVIVAFQGDPTRLVVMLILLVLLQQVVLSFLMPRIMSQTLGVPPLAVFASILFGGKLAGIAGAFFGVPVVGILAAMLNLYREQREAERRAATRPAAPAPAPFVAIDPTARQERGDDVEPTAVRARH